jgi:hypothetical protein
MYGKLTDVLETIKEITLKGEFVVLVIKKNLEINPFIQQFKEYSCILKFNKI